MLSILYTNQSRRHLQLPGAKVHTAKNNQSFTSPTIKNKRAAYKSSCYLCEHAIKDSDTFHDKLAFIRFRQLWPFRDKHHRL